MSGPLNGCNPRTRFAVPGSRSLQTFGEFLQTPVCVDTRQRRHVAPIRLLGDLGSPMQVGNPSSHLPPSACPFAVPFFPPVHLEIVNRVDGGFYAKDTPSGPQRLAIGFRRIPGAIPDSNARGGLNSIASISGS